MQISINEVQEEYIKLIQCNRSVYAIDYVVSNDSYKHLLLHSRKLQVINLLYYEYLIPLSPILV